MIRNVHERHLTAPHAEVAAQVASLASAADRLWPVQHWPRMHLDNGLTVGGHGFEIERVSEDVTLLRHVLAMQLRGPAFLTWPLVYRPLHDALIEDALDRAVGVTDPPRWSWWVRALRWALS